MAEQENDSAVPGGPWGTARVADSYGVDPHEHKPSQDPFDAGTADEKQAETGGVVAYGPGVDAGEDESSAGISSSTSDDGKRSSSGSSPNETVKPARTTGSRTPKDPTGSSSADSTGSGPAR